MASVCSFGSHFITTRKLGFSLIYLNNQIEFLVEVSVDWLQKSELRSPGMHVEEAGVVLGGACRARDTVQNREQTATHPSDSSFSCSNRATQL